MTRAVRLVHFTDLHFTADPSSLKWRDLLSKRFLGWLNLTILGRRADFAGAPRITRAFVEDLAEVRPDHLVCTGDLTGLSLPEENEAAREALAPLLAAPNIVGIPGNHDVYVREAVEARRYEGAFGPWTRTDAVPADLPPGLRDLFPYPLVKLLGEDATVFLLRDTRPNSLLLSSGAVGPRQLEALEALLETPRFDRPLRVVALHYGLCRGDRSPDASHHALDDAAELRELLARKKVHLVLHGHLHRRFVLPATPAWPFVIANPGSLTSARPHHVRAYHVLEVAGGRVTLAARRYVPEKDRFEAWPGAPGAGLLREAGQEFG